MKRIRYLWFYLFLGVCIYFPVAWLGDHRDLAKDHAILNWQALGVALCCQWGCWWLACATWRHLLLRHSQVQMSWLESGIQLTSVLLGKYLPGKIWGLLARGARMTEAGIAGTDILALSLLEQYYTVCTGGYLAVCLFLAWVGGATAWLALPMFVVGVIYTERLRHLAWAVVRRWPRYRDLPALSLSWRGSLRLQAGYLGVWLLQSAALCLLYPAFFLTPASVGDYVWLVASNIAGILIGFLALFAPGGIGVRELVATSLASNVIPWDAALALQLIARAWLVLHEVLVGGLIVGVGAKCRPQQ